MEQREGPRIWRFGGVELDEASATVRLGGRVQPLDRSSYDVLLALLRNRGDVVTRNELLEAGWPGRIVSENSLSKAISRLRQLLGPDGASLRVVHGYGYRLAAPVEASPPPAATPAAAPGAADPVRLRAGDALPFRPGWTLREKLGEGSAGVIFLARSEDGQARAIKFSSGEAGLRTLKREVALSRYLVSRGDAQPPCVPVLGWNLGQPPFFLELPYFEGGNLKDWAAAQGGLATLPVQGRLDLAIALCESVAGLHALGLIHRDLKPENLYPVQDAGARGGFRVLLADLGSSDASATPQLAALGITLTLVDSASGGGQERYPGSLLYIAPEVVAGAMPTQRSDVFALGLLTFQLAVGDLRRSLAPGWERDVHDPLLCEDIALACAADPDRRALDAGGLAARLASLPERHRKRAAELARAQEERDRERQAIRDRGRRRILLAVTGALAVGLAAASTLYLEAESAREQAEQAVRQRQAVLDFVTGDILGQGDPYRNLQARASLTLIEAVDRAARTVDERLTDPAAAAAVHALVADVYFGQDRHADAIVEYERARALYRGLGGEHARAMVEVETGLCDVHRIAGQLELAREACESAMRHAPDAGAARDLATLKLGQLRGEEGANEASLALLRPLMEADAFVDDPRLRGELYWGLGLAERGLGRYDAAQRHFEALLALNRGGQAPGTWRAWALNSLGSIQASTGDFQAAEATLLEARRLFQASQGSGQVEAQMPNIWRGEIRLRQERWDEAAALQQSLLDAWRPTLRPDHPLVLKAEANLAWAQAEAGRDGEARALLDAALGARETVLDRAGPGVAVRAMRWARAALALGDAAAAQALLAVMDAHLEHEFPARHPVPAEGRCVHARLAHLVGDAAASAAYADACARMLEGFVDAAHPLAREARALLPAR